MSAAPAPVVDDNEFTTTHHVYLPHRNGVPPLKPYFAELWRRREFAAELSKANMRAASSMTFFGQLWLIINPLLLAGVYYFLVVVLSGGNKGLGFFAHLTAGLFTFYFVSGSMTTGAASVTSGGRILLNTSMPRLLMPLSAVRTAFFRFLPTVPIFLLFHLLAGNPITWATLTCLPFLAMIVGFSAGLAALFATLQVYFRDVTSFLPYIVRIWLYASPVIWTVDQIPTHIRPYIEINPLFAMLGGFSEALSQGTVPALHLWVVGTLWSLTALVVGCLYFMSRERDFAVRV